MTKPQTPLLVTPSLLNSWLYIWLSRDIVKESANDAICLEDKQDLAMQKAYDEFLGTLQREQTPPNENMLRGIQYEDDCYKGLTDASPIIKGGAFQIVGKKNVIVDNVPFLMYGRLDVLKNGIIYDIQRVTRYTTQKYLHSAQHGFYLDLFQDASQFTYLAFDGNKLHQETYYRGQYKPTEAILSDFIQWLRENNLWDVYASLWASKKGN